MSAPTSAAREQTYATMLLNDLYLPGALVLAHSLRDAGTDKKLAVLVTLDSVSANAISQLEAVYDYILPVSRIRNEHPTNLYLMNRSDLHSAFTKINLWKQTQFSKIVYIDADVVAYRAPDELFDLPHAFSAAPDVGWPDISNTGVMVLTPSLGDYYAMLAMAERGISFDGADQGLINTYFEHSTNRLSFTYNVTPSAHYQYIPAYLHFQSSISMVHFIGANKPWFSGRHSAHRNDPVDEMIGRWWAVHDRHYRAQTSAPDSMQRDQQQHNTVYNDATDGPMASTPAVHTVDDHTKKTNTSPSIVQEQAEHSPRPGSITASRMATDAEDSGRVETAEHHPTQQTQQTTQITQTTQHSPTPINTWDAQRQPPPIDSKPEAINFPSTHYEMSRDTTPFVPPVRYPSPPRNMWYEIPEQPPSSADKPRQIFPWEAKQPTPSRSFIDPLRQERFQVSRAAESRENQEALAQDLSLTGASPDSGIPSISVTTGTPQEEKSETALATTGDPWNSFSRANAWDEVPEIGRYVEGLQKRRCSKSRGSFTSSGSATSPSAAAGTLQMPRALKVTEFPTEVERPSLPVTPAPMKRPSFWGEDNHHFSAGDRAHPLPAAEGVPSQPDWDPAVQLQKLAQQQSEALLRRLSGSDGATGRRLRHDIPSRPLPFGSASLQSPTYVAQACPSSVLSPQPVPGKTRAANLVEGLVDAKEDSPSETHGKDEGTRAAEHEGSTAAA
ncbi:hypothetical protein C2857_002077 [Epichloe festucae Fl1]|uniref:glycogenin glucosyltransferase n=1 Tax=Epichloe festucae (strain Fl1) TaxID=877507 RepID=A0A7U3Q1L9_EPIFF|nr:hypothetical protein C2857_002077 [Epichloe festucae Fl1]